LLEGKRIDKTLLMTRFWSVLVGFTRFQLSAFSFQLCAFRFPVSGFIPFSSGLALGAGVLSRHTVTSVDIQRLAKAQPVTLADTNRN
jgi:hypothetical protein